MLEKSSQWSKWYLFHSGGTGVRVKVQPRSTSVEGQAGSMSQMVKIYEYDNEYQVLKVKGKTCIRFSFKAYKRNRSFLDTEAYSLQKYLDDQIKYTIKDNGSTLEDWI